jgi:SAM-dependent methyltransferase
VDRPLYDEFNDIQERHWWFVGRRRTFIQLIDHYLYKNEYPKILDIGCGTGANMRSFAEFGDILGIDLSMDALKYCEALGFPLFQANITNIPFKNDQFDVVTAFDVIEHIEDDFGALREIYRVCRIGGIAVLAVPAFEFLWGEHDELAHHLRRYTLRQLRAVVLRSGFEIERISYNNFFLFPIGLVFRYIKRFLRILNKSKEIYSDFTSTAPAVVNPVLREIYALEGKLLKYLNFPIGLTIICICRKGKLP